MHTGGPERWRVISVACGGRHTMALALPDNGEVNNREVRRLTSDSGGMADFEEDEDEEYEHHGELQNGEYDDEEADAGAFCLHCILHACFPSTTTFLIATTNTRWSCRTTD